MSAPKMKPDIRALTRLVPPSGNLVQGQSELSISPELARAASELIASGKNHYCPAEGTSDLRRVVAEKIAAFNGLRIDPDAVPFQLLITPGATGGLVSVAQTYLRQGSALVFEPYYPYHRRIIAETGGSTEVLSLRGDALELDEEELFSQCKNLKNRSTFPLRAIIVCSPANPTGKVFTRSELESIGRVCRRLDLMCIADEVYEHHVISDIAHISMASLPGMWERTITVNSFSKSWNISGWRLGYAYGPPSLVGPLFNASNVFYVCSPTPLQHALAVVLMEEPQYYARLKEKFTLKRLRATEALKQVGFKPYDSGSAFYVWARIPEGFGDSMDLNDRLMKTAGVAAVPGGAFADSSMWDNHLRLCVAREDHVLDGALEKIKSALVKH